MIIRVSVRNLIEFILRNGSIDNRKAASPADAMQEGSRIHRKIQKQMGSCYQAEVVLKNLFDTDCYQISVEGRADGIFEEQNGNICIDEIKGTYRELKKIKEADLLHIAQAKCYAYIYCVQENLQKIRIRITYCNIDTEEIKYFYESYEFENLKQWYENLLNQYQKWTDTEFDWSLIRTDAIKTMKFPFEYRDGQKELVTYTYQTIYHGRKLFIEAPTGVGKTISTVFPSIKAMGEGYANKLFYLTAKTITRTVADHTFQLLRDNGLRFKSITLTAKEKICFQEKVECNPVACPYADGHFDRINDAIYDLIIHEEKFSRDVIEEYAHKHHVCPFEFSLDVSLFSDAVICDYNYLFDPHVYLKRFFADDTKKDYIFLIDEAHNLVDRGRAMYSAELIKEDFLEVKREIKGLEPKIVKQLDKCNKELLNLKRECTDYMIDPPIEELSKKLLRLAASIEDFLEEHEGGEIREKVLDFYFKIAHFNMIYELLDDKYVVYTQMQENGDFLLRLFNVDPSDNLKICMKKGRSSVLFSATLLPIQYYKKLLGGEETDYEVYAKSTFDEEKRGLFIGNDVTSKYTRRSEEEYYRIASYIDRIVSEKNGNYMVFFPSYQFLKKVYEIYKEAFLRDEIECIVQESTMSEEKRELFLGRFEGNSALILDDQIQFDIEEEDTTLVGFCIMGGLFSEGIDLKHDALIGAIIVGTGLPQVCNENEILKQYFDAMDESGFDYAYRYPGMNKVLQAAGRVIRTHEDIGIVALLDERFLNRSYQKMFPREWEHFEIVDHEIIGKRVERFWNEWLF